MRVLVSHWWTFVIRGVLAVLFGAATFFVPEMALLTLVFMFGFYAIAEGVFNVLGALRRTDRPEQEHWWALLLEGLASIAAGLIVLFIPGITALAMLYVVAAWAVATGVLKIVGAIRLRQQISGEWVLGLSGVLSILLGIMLASFPALGLLVMSWWIGAYALVFGALLIGLGVELRRWLVPRALPPEQYHGVAPGH